MSQQDILERFEAYLTYMSSDKIPFPQSLQIELTSYCNLKCIMCPKTAGVFRTEPDRTIDRDVLDYITTSLLPYVQRVDIVGDGEPLLEKELLFELLENAATFQVPVTLCTNGTLLDEATSRQLVELKLFDINISLDAATSETYSAIRGGDFRKVVTHIQKLSEIKKNIGSLIPHIHVSMVALVDNIHELPELLSLSSELGVESITVQAMGEESESLQGKSAFLHERDLAEEIIFRTKIEADLLGIPLKLWPDKLSDVLANNDNLKDFLSGALPPPGEPDEWRKDCRFLWTSPFITTNGDVRPCCAQLPPTGNLKNESFHNIWYNSIYSTYRKNLLSNQLPNACRTCPGMGWRRCNPVKSILNASDAAFDYFPGWYDVELEEREFRWTRDRASVVLKQSEADQFLLLQIRKAPYPEAPSRGHIAIDNETVSSFELSTTNWETIEIPLNLVKQERNAIIDISVTHDFRPVDVDENSSDPRHLGIKVSRIWFESWLQKVVFNQKLVLLGYDVVPETLAIGGTALFRTYWRSLDKMKENLKLFLHFTREAESGLTSNPLGRKFGFGRRDFFQLDYLMQVHGQTSNNWVPGMFIVQEDYFTVPEHIRAGHYRIEAGLYPEGSPKARLKIIRSDRVHSDNKALLGTIIVSEKKL